MKKYITGIFAVAIALSLTFGLSSFKKDHVTKQHPTTHFYYEFTGSHGNEGTLSLWVQLATIDDYNDFSCASGSNNSCKIINNTNSGTHPTSVPLDGSGFPQVGAVNSARVF